LRLSGIRKKKQFNRSKCKIKSNGSLSVFREKITSKIVRPKLLITYVKFLKFSRELLQVLFSVISFILTNFIVENMKVLQEDDPVTLPQTVLAMMIEENQQASDLIVKKEVKVEEASEITEEPSTNRDQGIVLKEVIPRNGLLSVGITRITTRDTG
jgi:hypothetical protein